jgi:hypothetical protein
VRQSNSGQAEYAVSLLSEVFEEQEAKSLSEIMFGRYMLADKSEHACQISDLTPDQARFSGAQKAEVGEHVIAYIEEIGRVEGDVTNADADSFLLMFTVPANKRDKIAAKLNWMQNRDEHGTPEMRRHTRHEPRDTNTVLTLPDGRSYECEILDISLSGAAIKAQVIPSIGTQVTLGKTKGTVTRIHECGVGIQFGQLLDEPELQRQIVS